MKWSLFCMRFFFFLIIALDSYCAGSYVALVPTQIKEHASTSVVLANVGSGGYSQFEVILHKSSSKELKSVVTVQDNEITTISFRTESLDRSSFKITIRDIEKSNKTHNASLRVIRKSTMVLIQTDKPIYKPGDTIKFRVLTLDQETKPVSNLKSINIKITDSKRNLIREWPYAKIQNGIFQSQLDLVNFIALGDWKIAVAVRNEDVKYKSITIAEYVLPKFEIRIKTSKLTSFKDKYLTLSIDARYTFGKPIKGILYLTVEGSKIENKTEINGRSQISIDLQSVIADQLDSDVVWLSVTANVEEAGSGHLYQSTETIPVYRTPYKLTLRQSSEYLIPEAPFRCWLKLTDPLGEPFEQPDPIKIEVLHEIRFWFDKTQTIEKKPDENGILELQFDISASTSKLNFEATYAGDTMHFSVPKENDQTNSRPFLKASVLTAYPKLNQSVELQIYSSFKIKLLFYFVVARGEIVSSGKLQVEEQRLMSCHLITNFKMVPRANLIVIAINQKRLVKDVVQFKVQDLRNFVNLTVSNTEIEPHKQLTVTAQSHPKSLIGFLAIDKGLLSLGTGNDLTKQALLDELDPQSFATSYSNEIEKIGFSLISDALTDEDIAESTLATLRFGDFESHSSSLHIRQDFSETWLWMDVATTDANGSLMVSGITPDSITNWQISAFSINPDYGLGIIDRPVSLNVYKNFFITVNLPYSITKTETLVMEVFVHNYFNQTIDSEVTLSNERNEFQLLKEPNQPSRSPKLTQMVSIPTNGVRKVTFLMKPTTTGDLRVFVTAEAGSAKDAVQRTLRVTPGGLQYYRNVPRFIEVDNSTQRFNDLKLIIPRVATPGSENITFSVEGILLAAALTNLDQLIRLPTGCGEQNMLNLVPSVIALDYMTNTGTINDAIKKKAIDFLQKGYQNQLNYKLQDGSFSVFGKSDGRGSVFLTAFVAKTLRIAQQHITVDNDVINGAYEWLKKNQESDGKFVERGKVHHRTIQGGLSGNVALTAYALIAFMEHKNVAQRYKSVCDKGASFLSDQVPKLDKPYELALVSYVLQMAMHPQKQIPLDKLLEQSRTDADLTERWWDSGATSIETAAYALLTYMNGGMYVDAKPIMEWLVSQRYDKGGYDNTQNTFLGLQALSEYSKKLSSSRNSYEVSVSYDGDKRHSVKVDATTSLSSQHLTLPSSVRNVNVEITGTGTGVFQIAYQYNAVAADSVPRFEIIKTVRGDGRSDRIELNVCSRFIPKNQYEITNMVLMEIMFPSGYVIADGTLTRLANVKEVRKVETKRDDTVLVLYFDSLPTEKSICVDISGSRRAIVIGQIAGWIKVYDYYDPTREAVEYFTQKYVNPETEL
ncbi:thioester-containing protein 1 allele R1-like isoform X2 [Malaya genurostris]|uniref:thioester-containing protein 1 allele R1-like isoform X2 n=1 Tax=Malaya genurostris TaxID=325434 RepID=UPI0026F405EE|nr:thioester-containing protein 1 allele R1-like isoform X2 [Malaya genurostris]